MIMTHIFFKLISVENFATFLCSFDHLWLRMLNHIRQFDESYSGLCCVYYAMPLKTWIKTIDEFTYGGGRRKCWKSYE